MVSSKLILASSSPQRAELLKVINIIPDEIIAANIDESILKNEGISQYVKRMALQKAQRVFLNNQENIQITVKQNCRIFVLAADTVIVKGHMILGKPKDLAEARYFLQLLSGKKHKVLTAFTVIAILPRDQYDFSANLNNSVHNDSIIKTVTKLVKTEVVFKRITSSEIEDYLQTNQWCNKSGGYGIQGYVQAFIKKINGSPSSVIGLPLFEVSNTLLGLGYMK